jgi:putative transposase
MMIDPSHSRLSIVRQCELVSISRSSFYREPAAESEETLRLMRLIDEQFLETPWYGSRQDGAASTPAGLVHWAPSCSSADDQDGLSADLPAPEDERVLRPGFETPG